MTMGAWRSAGSIMSARRPWMDSECRQYGRARRQNEAWSPRAFCLWIRSRLWCEGIVLLGVKVAERPKILVVEDDALIALELGERLDEMGYALLGPALTLEDAAALVAAERPAAALLDANLDGKSSVDLAVALSAQGVPVAFCTGYDRVKNLPPSLARARVLTKPVGDQVLLDALRAMIKT